MSEASSEIFTKLAADAVAWRKCGYPCDYPLIGEILRFQQSNDESGELRFLRTAQFAALEIYWYLRLTKNTPHIMELYKQYYSHAVDFAAALGIPLSSREIADYNSPDKIIQLIKKPAWAQKNRIDSIHEAATLDYPGYIFALAMGAGKTILIGAIIATEFSMALRYAAASKNNTRFMQNALVFAPGLTIIQSLREIADMPMTQILPPAIFREYAANIKIGYARAGQKNIPALHNSRYNIIVANSEKINLRAKTQRKSKLNQMALSKKNEQDELIANARLLTITSLPNLGVFSDEAHHTYGNIIGDSLKRVRETVNYIHQQTPLVAVINTTGTPYSKNRMLSEVVCWYGLGDGIKDNILKHLDNGVYTYDMADDTATISDVITKFFGKYKNTRLPNNAPAKIAFYFKKQSHLDECRQYIEKSMSAIGESPTQILVNTQQSSNSEVEDFNRLNDPENQKRVILLVQKGKEGWDCPSVFACALVKESSNEIYVLQAATRCLRQTPGNTQGASVFLSADNARKLDAALQKNFGTDMSKLQNAAQSVEVLVKIRKTQLPQLEITRNVQRTTRRQTSPNIVLTKPKTAPTKNLTITIGTPDYDSLRILQPSAAKTEQIQLHEHATDCYFAATRIAANYHLPLMSVLQQLQKLYPQGDIPAADFADLLRQIQKQTADYETTWEKIKEVLALIRFTDKNGENIFSTDKDGCFVHRLQFSKNRFERMQQAQLLVSNDGANSTAKSRDAHDLSYHYTPYCLDSAPEKDFLNKILAELNESPQDIKAFLFTGYANDKISDFYFHYEGADGAFHKYFPDFVLLKNNGEFFVVEIKAESEKDDIINTAKAKAVKSISNMTENRFRYVVIYAADAQIAANNGEMGEVRQWIGGN